MTISDFFPGLVYVLCAVTSLACALLLARGYRRSGARLLLWSSLCFIGLAVDNALLYLDRVVVPDIDLATIRYLPGLVGVMLLLYGLVWDSD
jgi:hypothetical protein